MSLSHLPRPVAHGLLAAAVSVLPVRQAEAVHAKNAGPEAVEIRFKLPPPRPLSAEEELATFRLPPGFRAELVAAEPLVDTPVALTWDEKGRLFVCEMRDYMHNVEGTGEDQSNGRIVVLEDTDGDGRMDKRTVFAEGLRMPRAVMCVNGGVLVGEPPNLWFMKDTDGDGVADSKESIDASFGTGGGQPEHMANSPLWMLDNWIYVANHSKRYRLKNGKFEDQVADRRGQWGLTQDDFGRPFFNSNSDLLRANLFAESLGNRNPNFPATAGLGVQIMKDQSTWPAHPTPGVNRGYEPKQLREDGTLAKSTATCGPSVYRGALFPKEFHGNVFVPEPAGNLIKRLVLSEKKSVLTAANTKEGSEFWTSTDERFRPVSTYTGPDGALYVVDMYRGVIQHTSFLTHYLIANIKDRNLEAPLEMGRIWRVVPVGSKALPKKLPEDTAKLVEALGSSEGWVRDTAQRLLVERNDETATAALAKLAKGAKNPLARIHAMWTLDGMGASSPEVITECLKHKEAKVRATAVRLASRAQLPELMSLVKDPSSDVQIALAFQLSSYPESQKAAFALALQSGEQPLVRDALLSGLRGRELETLQALLEEAPEAVPTPLVEGLSQAVLTERRKDRVKKLLEIIASQRADSPFLLAMLTGAAGKISTAKTSATPRLLYLETAPLELQKLGASSTPALGALVKVLDARLAWPGKPGVPPPPVVKPLNPAELALFDTGKAVYNALCVGCHQPTGAGMDGLAPALVDSEWVLGNPETLPRILLHGLAGPITVGKQSWNLEMPPLGAALNDTQIAGVLTYIRREWEHGASPVSAEFVAKIRTENTHRSKSWTGEELKLLVKAKASSAPAGDGAKILSKPLAPQTN
jgi:glucose/arabinose dehydrogenase/mono/diheme cytochrome c family protein